LSGWYALAGVKFSLAAFACIVFVADENLNDYLREPDINPLRPPISTRHGSRSSFKDKVGSLRSTKF
jgi:hypothetical protein